MRTPDAALLPVYVFKGLTLKLACSWGAVVPGGWEEVFHMAEVMAGPDAAQGKGSAATQRMVQRSLILDSRGLPALLHGLSEVRCRISDISAS